MRIAVGAAKGGVGKTTTAVHLATALAARGEPTVLVDGDRQRSATAWWRAAEADGWTWPLHLALWGWPDRGPMRLPSPDEAAHVVVDTGPGDSTRLREVMAGCDVTVIPSGPRGADLGQVGITVADLDAVTTGGRELLWAVLLTQVRMGTRSLPAAVAALAADDVPQWDTVIPHREAIATTYGTVPGVRAGPYADLLTEIMTSMED